MRWNKRGVMLKFLVGVLIALLVFTPTCMFTSKLFRVSEQAGSSFIDFAHDLGQFAESNEEKKSLLLTMDMGTGVYIFPRNSERIVRSIIQEPLHFSFVGSVSVNRPAECSPENSCVCLCQDLNPQMQVVEAGVGTSPQERAEITVCPVMSCKELDSGVVPFANTGQELGEAQYVLDFDSAVNDEWPDNTPRTFGVKVGDEIPNDPANYFIKGGIAIERHTEHLPFALYWQDVDARRKVIRVEKAGNKLLFENPVK